jgi:prepilin-type N-terminal cleavage/methylation domain-containing protein
MSKPVLSRHGRSRPGFTLAELLVVLGVLAVLLALIAPRVVQVQEAAKRVQCV